jgi:membrane protein YqaA with SNARE-associated domain
MSGYIHSPVPDCAGPEVTCPMEPSEARRGWLRHLVAFAHHRNSTWLLAAVAFADSSFLPVPPDLLLIPMSLARPERMRALLIICTVASSLGAVLGYLIGYGLWSTVGAPLVDLYGYQDSFAAYQRLIDEWGVSIIVAKALTPVPFKIAAIAAGVAAMNPLSFMIATILWRALHFAMLAGLILIFGARIMTLVARYERPFAVISLLVLIGLGFACYLR